MPKRILALLLLVHPALFGLGCSSSARYAPVVTAAEVPARGGKVLMVLSSAGVQRLRDGSTRATGTFLGEFYEPYAALVDAGYEVVLATPQGAPPVIDPESLRSKYWAGPEPLRQARTVVRQLPQWSQPLTLAAARARSAEFRGLVVPGGQGVMVDLLENADLHALITELGKSGRPVGLVCHAPAVLTRMSNAARPLPGARITAVSGFEEWYIETFVMGSKAQVRGIAGSLEDAGYAHDAALPGRAYAVRDCNLVTSQNPFSGGKFSAYYLEAMHDYERGARCRAVRR